MKNKFKKLLAFAVFAIMAMAMAVTAMADGIQHVVTITAQKGVSTGNIYNVYQIATFNVTKNADNATVYTNIEVLEKYKGKFKPEDYNGEAYDEPKAIGLAEKLAEIALKDPEIQPYTTTNKDQNTVSLPEGYYLFVEKEHTSDDPFLATRYILVAVDGKKDVILKTSEADLTKKIVLEDSTSNVDGADPANTLVDANVVAIGDTITYQIDANIPDYPNEAHDITYYITDEMSAGLIDGAVTKVEIKGSSPDSGYTELASTNDYTVTQSGNNFKIYIYPNPQNAEGGNKDKILNYKGGAVRITLTAVLGGEGVNVGTTGNPNSAELTYTNNWEKGSTYTTKPDTVITYTGKLTIKKTDAADGVTPLNGAKFAIYTTKSGVKSADDKPNNADEELKDEQEKVYAYYYKTITTDEKGLASIEGLDNGTYYAVEIEAPEGYSLVKGATPIEVKATKSDTLAKLEQNGEVVNSERKQEKLDSANTRAKNHKVAWTSGDGGEVNIKDKKGTTLPGTGGMGTTIFTIGGIVLVALAALMFVFYMRKQKKQA